MSVIGGPYLLAVHTLHRKLLLVAGHAEVVVLLGDEALGADGLLASLAGEAGLVPAVALVLHFPGAFRKTRSGDEWSLKVRKGNRNRTELEKPKRAFWSRERVEV